MIPIYRLTWTLLTCFVLVPTDAWMVFPAGQKNAMLATTRRTTSSTTSRLYYFEDSSSSRSPENSDNSNNGNSNNNNNNNNNENMDRMQAVRALQAAFYKPSHDEEEQEKTQRLDLFTGIFHNLPLWRVQWNEVPGRTNVLNVHEGIYTNMFETILHQSPPWYVGHLYLPEGSRNIKSKNQKLALCSWDKRVVVNHDNNNNNDDDDAQRAKNSNLSTNQEDESAVVGTILRITDYRRMVDGRLLLLVQAMERFVVAEVQQEIPYSVAHVQIIPDTEEIEESNWRRDRTEGDVFAARALAVQESFERWHRYEHENTMLPLPMEADLEPTDVMGSALAKVLPYSPFSSVVQASKLRHEILKEPTPSNDEDDLCTLTVDCAQNTLEERLVKGHVLEEPLVNPELAKLSIDELEIKLWFALNDFLKNTRTPVSPVLLGLLPVGRKWPRNFVLERIANAVEEQTELDHKYVRISAEYPALRRQKRLSYSAAALLEDPDSVTTWRRQLLSIPSTKDRLAFVLQRFQTEYGDPFQ